MWKNEKNNSEIENNKDLKWSNLEIRVKVNTKKKNLKIRVNSKIEENSRINLDLTIDKQNK